MIRFAVPLLLTLGVVGLAPGPARAQTPLPPDEMQAACALPAVPAGSGAAGGEAAREAATQFQQSCEPAVIAYLTQPALNLDTDACQDLERSACIASLVRQFGLKARAANIQTPELAECVGAATADVGNCWPQDVDAAKWANEMALVGPKLLAAPAKPTGKPPARDNGPSAMIATLGTAAAGLFLLVLGAAGGAFLWRRPRSPRVNRNGMTSPQTRAHLEEGAETVVAGNNAAHQDYRPGPEIPASASLDDATWRLLNARFDRIDQAIADILRRVESLESVTEVVGERTVRMGDQQTAILADLGKLLLRLEGDAAERAARVRTDAVSRTEDTGRSRPTLLERLGQSPPPPPAARIADEIADEGPAPRLPEPRDEPAVGNLRRAPYAQDFARAIAPGGEDRLWRRYEELVGSQSLELERAEREMAALFQASEEHIAGQGAARLEPIFDEVLRHHLRGRGELLWPQLGQGAERLYHAYTRASDRLAAGRTIVRVRFPGFVTDHQRIFRASVEVE